MLTGSETVTVQTTPSPPTFFSRSNFPVEDRANWPIQSLREGSPSKTSNTIKEMNSQRSRRDSREQQEQQQAQQQGATSGSIIARSMSRYRRRTSSVTVDVDATQKINSDPPSPWEPPKVPPVPTIPPQLRTTSITQKGDGTPADLESSPPRHQLRHTDIARRHTLRRSMAEQYQSRPSTAKSAKSEESSWRRLASRDGRRNRLNSGEEDETAKREMARLEAENHRLLSEQKKKDLERLEMKLGNNHKAAIQAQSHKSRSPVIEKFALLARGRRSKDSFSPGFSPASSTTSINHAKTFSTGIEAGGRGIVPQTDAPHSAINAGDRNVAVRYKQHTFSVEVTPDTTTDDILIETSKMMGSNDMGPTNCVLVEIYGALGLERRLRRYERIRDVMNSWDRDTLNQLTIRVSGSEDDNWDLDIRSVPGRNEPLQGFQLYMYHSNRPGKWNKRWITLLDNGQVLSAKKPNTNSADKDSASLCRLTDYDIYTPTESQMRRHIKPPKRYCFAVKSQQKTTVFMNTENFVQYFCTEDPKIAAQFRERVQGWRSWYIKARIPEPTKAPRKMSIRKTDDKPPQIALPTAMHTPKKSVNVASMNGHRLRVSVDEGPYPIGQFEPLLDMKRFDKRLSQFGQDFLPPVPDVSTMPKQIPAHHLNPSAKNEKQDKAERKLVGKVNPVSNDGFTGSGLLAEGYEERRHTHTESDRPERGRAKSRDDGFINGPSLLNEKSDPDTPVQKPESPSWFPSALAHSAKQRSTPSSPSIRPSTSAGVMHSHTHSRRPSLSSSSRPPPPTLSSKPLSQEHPHPLSSQPTGLSLSHSNRRERPKPLINIESSFQEAPQWSKDKHGHGVKAPEGMTHLIDLITVPSKNSTTTAGAGGGGSNTLEVPPRSALRRGPSTAPLPSLSRTRSKTQGAPAPQLSSGGAEVPPVPLLPARPAAAEPLRSNPAGRSRERERDRDREKEREKEKDKERVRERERVRGKEKEREYSAYNAVPGRTGTLKVV
ncbi:hypothetical protein GGR54DRAFT_611355 [Hypoxylon sp. NC1633]|nr:hypothetical protein GGR54DRAFT_611355 [Hypoxylon sp. NC1633]